MLEEQPRINSSTVDLQRYLAPDKAGTLGQAYARFMVDHDLDQDSRPLVKFVPDYELAYVMQRYREVPPSHQVHDFIHPLIGCGSTSLLDEVSVKLFEMVQLQLPVPSAHQSTILASTVGSLLTKEDFCRYLRDFNRIHRIASRGEFILNIYIEQVVDMPLEEVRAKYNFV